MHAIATPSPAPIWTRARVMFARAAASLRLGEGLGAEPADASAAAALRFIAALARLALLTRALRRSLIAWLAPLEHVVRKLLLAEAAALHADACARARRAPRLEHVPLNGMARTWSAGLQTRNAATTAGAPKQARATLDIAHPETWRAPFSFALPRDPHAVRGAHAPCIRALWGADAPAVAVASAAETCATQQTPFHLARRFEALRRVLDNPRPHAERLARLLARAVARAPNIATRYLYAPCHSNDFDSADPRLGIDAISTAFAAPGVFRDSS